jgi:hypothetical protein
MPDNSSMTTRKVIGRCLIALILSTLVIAPVGGCRWYVDREGRKLRDAAITRIETTDPRWRWEDIEADLPALRNEDNASLLVAEFRNTVGIEQYFRIDFRPERGPIHTDLGTPCNHIPTDFAYSIIDKELDSTEVAWPVVGRLANTPRGRCTFLSASTWAKRRRPDNERIEPVLNYLEWEAERQARANHPERQETIVRAYLNIVRIEEVRPYTGGPLGRHHRLDLAARLVERLLALDCLGDRLPRLQAEFAAEAEVELFRPAVRETRAVYDKLFQAFATGEVSLTEEFTGRSSDVPIREMAEVWMYRPQAAADWAGALDFATDMLAVADLPDAARSSAFAAIPLPPADGRHPFALGCARNLKSMLDSSLRTRALLRCTATALAVERCRQLTGAWPASLEAIPKAVLPAVPADPFTGSPLGYSRTAEGVTISSTGVRTAFRLYDPSQRRLPPLPLPARDDD